MNKMFVPTGSITFLGSGTDLHELIFSLFGKMENERDFHCYISVPARKRYNGVSFVIVRGRTSFLFRGTITPSGENYRVTYKVYPALSSAIFLLVPVYFFIQTLLTWTDMGFEEGTKVLAVFALLSALPIGAFLLLRRLAIRQFIKKFEEDWTDFEGIFD